MGEDLIQGPWFENGEASTQSVQSNIGEEKRVILYDWKVNDLVGWGVRVLEWGGQ